MRLSALFFHTSREAPADADSTGERLLSRGGFLQRAGHGLPVGSPLLARTVRKIEAFLRAALEPLGAQEILAPALLPLPPGAEVEPGTPEDLSVARDGRATHTLAADPLGPALALALHTTRSHRPFPLALYRLGPRHALPERAGAGLLRLLETRELHVAGFALDAAQEKRLAAGFRDLLAAAASACGVSAEWVHAGAVDNPRTGLRLAVADDTGPLELLRCDACRAAFVADLAPLPPPAVAFIDYGRPMETISTPAIRSVDELVRFTGIPAHQMVKTVLLRFSGGSGARHAAVLMRGDLEISFAKVARHLDAARVDLCDPGEVVRLTGAAVGFAGPFGLPATVRLLADPSAAACRDFLCGLNRTDFHNIQVRFGRDLPEPEVADLRLPMPGEPCPLCGAGAFARGRAIPLGAIRHAGTAPAVRAGFRVTGTDGKLVHPDALDATLDLYALVAAAAETRREGKGFLLPPAVAPFAASVIPALADPAALRAAELAWSALRRAGVDAALDDRDGSAGAKFADAALMGVPLLAVAGKAWLAEERFEVEDRRDGSRRGARLDELPALLAGLAGPAEPSRGGDPA